MNYQIRLERLRERFLRATTPALLESACVEGGLIVKHYFSDGGVVRNQELTNFYADYLNAADDTRDELAAGFILSSGFKSLARAASGDPNVLALKEVSRVDECLVLITTPDSHSDQSERLAAFCQELIESIGRPIGENDELYQKAIVLWQAGELSWSRITVKLGEPENEWRSFQAAVKRFAKKSGRELQKRAPGAKRKT